MKAYIIYIVTGIVSANLFAQVGPGIETPPPCGSFSWNYLEEIRDSKPNQIPNLTITGDSRARFVSEYQKIRNFANASKDGKPLILPNQINSIQNLGWASATASDDQRDIVATLQNYVAGSPGAHKEKTWWRRWDYCKPNGNAYTTHPKTVFNLGGNDMVNFEKFYNSRDGMLPSLTSLANAAATLLSGKGHKESALEKELRWNWAFHLKEEIILLNMKGMANRILNQSPLHQLLVVDIAPRGPAILGNGLQDIGRIMRTNVYISRLNRKYYDRLVPELRQKHGEYRVHFLDVFNRFYSNLMAQNASYYYSLARDDLGFDGIHYNKSGNQQFALMITAKMLRLRWFQKDPNITDEMLDGISAGIPMDLSSVCDLKCWATICYLTKYCKFTDLLRMYFDSMLDSDFWTDLENNPPDPPAVEP